VRFAPDSELQAEALCDYLLANAHELGGAVIFPTRDLDVAFLDRYRTRLEPHYRVGIAPHEALDKIMDKYVLASIATEVGVPTPRTAVARSASDIDRIGASVGFPCVLKPTRSLHWREHGQWEKMGSQKAVPIASLQELREEYAKAASINNEVLVQEFIPGDSSDLASACAYIGADGDAKAYFTAGIVLKYPDHLGTGCLVEQRDIPELREPTLRLLKVLRYRGVADVEYKRDPRDGRWKLIEINTRHWDWHEIGHGAGVSMTRAAYEDFTCIPLPWTRPAVPRTRWINEESLFFCLARSIYHRQMSLPEAARLLHGHRQYGVLDWRDPRPFFWWLGSVFLPAIRTRLARRPSRPR
jgi:predicted ATP-grasp superfamily ATP-dependent carboligase